MEQLGKGKRTLVRGGRWRKPGCPGRTQRRNTTVCGRDDVILGRATTHGNASEASRGPVSPPIEFLTVAKRVSWSPRMQADPGTARGSRITVPTHVRRLSDETLAGFAVVTTTHQQTGLARQRRVALEAFLSRGGL